MLKYIPHANNTHSWRTFLFIFFVMAVSAGSAYFVYAFPGVMRKDISPLVVDSDVLIEEPATTTPIPLPVLNPPSVSTTPLEIVKAPPLPPIERNKNPETRIEEAKNYAQPLILTGKYIDISLKYQNMVIFEDGEVIDAYQISSGKKGLDTPIGTFKIENKSPKAWSKGYGLWMPNWMAIIPSGKIGIHELPIWPGGYQEGAAHLGIPVSHGCVRLGVGSAKRVFDWAEIGTPVVVHL